jgi:hypothetical protein
MRELKAFTGRLSSCEGLDALLSTALDALADLFGHRHSFVMFPDEDGPRLDTGANYGFDPSGVGSEVIVGEGMLGLSVVPSCGSRTSPSTGSSRVGAIRD